MHDDAIETTMTVEKRTIDHIPVTERHGKARDLFTIWFGSNIMSSRRPSTACRSGPP